MKFKHSILFAAFSLMIAAGCQTQQAREQASYTQKDTEQATEQVTQSADIIRRMEANPEMASMLQKSKGVFIIPKYGRAAFGVGGQGGEGILLLNQAGRWGDPVFYNFGGVSIGLQAGIEGGDMAFILNNDRAVQQFRNNDNFRFGADAGLTVVDWSVQRQADFNRADVIAWSDTQGLFGSAAIGVQDVRFDQKDTNAFYGQTASLDQVLSGSISAPQEKTAPLKQALMRAGSMSGGSQTGGSSEESEEKDQ